MRTPSSSTRLHIYFGPRHSPCFTGGPYCLPLLDPSCLRTLQYSLPLSLSSRLHLQSSQLAPLISTPLSTLPSSLAPRKSQFFSGGVGEGGTVGERRDGDSETHFCWWRGGLDTGEALGICYNLEIEPVGLDNLLSTWTQMMAGESVDDWMARSVPTRRPGPLCAYSLPAPAARPPALWSSRPPTPPLCLPARPPAPLSSHPSSPPC